MQKLCKTALLGAVLAASACSANSQTWLTNGLVAYYPFNGNANDASGNTDNGTVYGATLAPDRFLAQGRAYYFEATFYDAIMTSGTNLPLGTSQKSFSCWFRTSTPYLYSEYMWSCGQIKPDSLLGARLFYVNGVDAGLQSLCITVGIISISRELRMELGINMWSL